MTRQEKEEYYYAAISYMEQNGNYNKDAMAYILGISKYKITKLHRQVLKNNPKVAMNTKTKINKVFKHIKL